MFSYPLQAEDFEFVKYWDDKQRVECAKILNKNVQRHSYFFEDFMQDIALFLLENKKTSKTYKRKDKERNTLPGDLINFINKVLIPKYYNQVRVPIGATRKAQEQKTQKDIAVNIDLLAHEAPHTEDTICFEDFHNKLMAPLTERQRFVFQQIVLEGEPRKFVSTCLDNITKQTIEFHRREAIKKLQTQYRRLADAC